MLHRYEQDRRIRGIIVLSEHGADKPVLRDCDKYDDNPTDRALNDLADRTDTGRQEWIKNMLDTGERA